MRLKILGILLAGLGCLVLFGFVQRAAALGGNANNFAEGAAEAYGGLLMLMLGISTIAVGILLLTEAWRGPVRRRWRSPDGTLRGYYIEYPDGK